MRRPNLITNSLALMFEAGTSAGIELSSYLLVKQVPT